MKQVIDYTIYIYFIPIYFKTTIPNNNYDRPKTTGECEMF